MGINQARKILFVHGISAGDDAHVLCYSAPIRNGIQKKFGFNVTNFIEAKWASAAQEQEKRILPLTTTILDLFAGVPGVTQIRDALDLISDVFVYQNSKAGSAIRQKVWKDFNEHGPVRDCVLFAHSLGTVIAFDLLVEAIKRGDYEKPKSEWPYRCLVTTGSPLNLPMFANARKDKLVISDLLPWYNICDKNDPVVTGDAFGVPHRPLMYDSYHPICDRFVIKDTYINSGFHIGAHNHYQDQVYTIDKVGRLISE